MQFYYKDQLMRTSKNHIYNYAVIIEDEDGIRCYGCHKDKKDCEAEINGKINEVQRGIDNANEALKALADGKEGYYVKGEHGRRYSKFTNKTTVQFYKNWILDNMSYIEKIRKTYKIVELEIR